MRRSDVVLVVSVLATLATLASACAPPLAVPGRDSRGVIVVGREDRGHGKHRGGRKHRGPRVLRIPPGHYPPPGHCRLWYPGRPPGQQPPPVPCGRLRRGGWSGGVFLLYNGRAWDPGYDWRRHERRNPGSVPDVILRLRYGRPVR